MIAEIKAPELKVLIVDDSPLIVARLEQTLAGIPQVEFSGSAGNLASALLLIQERVPDVVILDIHLERDAPNASGITLLAAVRQLFPQITAIMLTNLSEDIYRNTCMKMGAKYFLDKSNQFEKIHEILVHIINENKTTKA